MAEKNKKITKCTACGETVSKKAKACPHCGQKNPSNRTTMTTWIVGFLILFAIIGSFDTGTSSYSASKSTEAYYTCKQFIRKRLNDPSSLDFPDSNTADITRKDDTYLITGTFRANNAFGGKIQTAYTCRIKENVNRDTWTLLYLSEF